MFKKVIIILFLFLCGCSNLKQVSCVYHSNDNDLELTIEAINDDVLSIKETSIYNLPSSVFVNEEIYKTFLSQIKDDYYVEDDKIIIKRDLKIDNKYSLYKTIEYLKKMRFNCE